MLQKLLCVSYISSRRNLKCVGGLCVCMCGFCSPTRTPHNAGFLCRPPELKRLRVGLPCNRNYIYIYRVLVPIQEPHMAAMWNFRFPYKNPTLKALTENPTSFRARSPLQEKLPRHGSPCLQFRGLIK